MKDIYKITVGSEMFFKGIEGFSPHDHDILYIMDEWSFPGTSAMIRKEDTDIFLYPDKGIELINDCIKQNDPITAGKFLVPEFCKYIGASISDITVLAPLFDRMDDKHKYETYIFNCYIQNNDMSLTPVQLDQAYTMYKEARA